MRSALRDVLERAARALSFDGRARSAEEPNARLTGGNAPEPRPGSAGSDSDELLDRERQVRVLMSSWM